MKKVWLVAGVSLGLFLMAGCQTTEEKKTAETVQSTTQTVEQAEVTATISLVKDDKTIDEKTVTADEDTSVMTVMKDNFEMEEDQGMITSIEGVEQSKEDNSYWMYTVNGEMAEKGANDTVVKDGDEIVFTYTKF
jgi:hypothetical protein